MSRTQIATAIMQSTEYRAGVVTGLYRSLLSRSPAPSEVAFWIGVLSGGAADEQGTAVFVGSPEYFTHAT